MVAFLALPCLAQTPPKKGSSVTHRPYGKMPDGTSVEIYTLSNRNGMSADILTYGGAVARLTAPDRNGKFADVVLGMDNLEGYRTQANYFGALIGRYGNRIGNGTFDLEGKTYHLPKNDGENTLHGGTQGFDKRVWKARAEKDSLRLTYTSADGEEGFPGTLKATVVYTLTDANELKLDYTATSDKPTVLNLTNHSYFNLAGSGTVLQHEVTILADRFTPVDAGLIPTGELLPVKGTPFDFTQPTAIGAHIQDQNQQLALGHGYDHNFVLNSKGGRLAKAAVVYDPQSGRVMEVWTDQPGLQFYTGNFLDGKTVGKGGVAYPFRAAFCMETQHFPDSPNKPEFPSTELRPGQTYHTITIYKFSAR